MPAKQNMKLPSEIIIMKNADKEGHESWYPGRSLADPPHPCRWIFAGPPNAGKSNIILNILLRVSESKQPFRRVVLIHGAGPHTREYEGLTIDHHLDDVPPADFFMELQKQEQLKSVVILDDVDLGDLSKQQQFNLSALFRFVSSHFGWSIFCSFQSFTDMSMISRKCSNIFTIWRPRSIHELSILANRLGVTKDQLKEAMDEHLRTRFDNLTFDFTPETPAPIRKNLFQEIII